MICNLKKITEQKGITLKQLAKATKISINTLKKYYQNTIVKIDFKTLDKLCRYFNCSTDDIFVIKK